MNLGPPNTNPFSGREEDLNWEPPDYKSSALTTRPRRLRIARVTAALPERKNREGDAASL